MKYVLVFEEEEEVASGNGIVSHGFCETLGVLLFGRSESKVEEGGRKRERERETQRALQYGNNCF